MIEINVKLTMSEEGNILIECGSENKYTINFEDKIINAQKIYNLLDYKPEYIYKLISNIEDIEDDRMKEYFEDVIDLIQKITNDINELNEIDIEEEKKEDSIELDDKLEDLI